MTVKDILKIHRESPVTRIRFNRLTNEVFLDDDKPKLPLYHMEKNKWINI